MEADSLGRPFLIATAYNGVFDTARVAVLVWPDSAWSVRVLGGYAGQLFPEPIVSPYSTHHVVNVVEEFPSCLDWVTWTDISYDGIAVPETVMQRSLSAPIACSAAASTGLGST